MNATGDDYLPSRAIDGQAGGFYRYEVGSVPLAGDYDGDGDVDTDDYAVWAAAFGGSNPAADGNGDGVVGADDYTVWRDAYSAGGGVRRFQSLRSLACWSRRSSPTLSVNPRGEHDSEAASF